MIEGLKILVADDEEDIRELLQMIMSSQGAHVTVAVDGQEAIDIIEKEKNSIDLILSDFKMPKKNGHDIMDFLNQVTDGCKPQTKRIRCRDSPLTISPLDITCQLL